MGTCLVLIAPLLVTLALKVNSLVGIDAAPRNLSLVTGVGALVAMFGNPLLGRMSDRTTSRLGMRRPWMAIGLVGGSLGVLRRRRGPERRRSCWSAGASPSCSSTGCSPRWSRCCRTRSRSPSAAWSPVCSASACPSASVGGTYVVQLFERQPGRDVPRAVRHRRPAGRAVRRSGSTTGGWRRRTGRPGRCASSSAPSTSTRAATPDFTWAFVEPASCSSRPTRSW